MNASKLKPVSISCFVKIKSFEHSLKELKWRRVLFSLISKYLDKYVNSDKC